MSRSLILAVALCGCLTKDEKLALFDGDEDGFHTEASVDWGGEAPWDCDDEDPNTYPGAAEVCDEKDNDCNGAVDDGVGTEFYADGDGDLFGDDAETAVACTLPVGFAEVAGDCDDTDDDVNPDAVEACNEVDDNCADGVDEAGADGESVFWADVDDDGYGDSTDTVSACEAPTAYVPAGKADCDDEHATVNDGLTEVCSDGLDNDCDGTPNQCVLSGTIDLVTGADQVRYGAKDYERLGIAMTTGDLNDDGVDDLVLATEGTAPTGGRVDVWFGGSDFDLEAAPDVSLVGGTVFANPRALCVADTSGDGKDDLVVGWSSSASSAQITYAIYNGVLTSSTTTASPITLSHPGASGTANVHIACGDFRGSAPADLVLTRPDAGAYEGPFSSSRDLASPNLNLVGFNWFVDFVSGDGLSDLIEAASGLAFYGPVVDVTVDDLGFAISLSVSGFDSNDIDFDGLPELLVGDEGFAPNGRVLFYLGRDFSPSQPIVTADARLTPEPGSVLSRAVFVGDLDLDGTDDVLAIPRPLALATSEIFVVSGAHVADGGDVPVASGMIALEVPAVVDPFVDALGADLNADGTADILVAAPTTQNAAQRGGVFLLFGRAP